jgi:predicted DNA-binding transcriptional regulator AlpA
MDTAQHKPVNTGRLPPQLLRINDVVALTTMSKSCVRLWVAQGRFPQPVALSSTLKVWRSSDISEWVDQRFSGVESSMHSDLQGPASTVSSVGRNIK